MNDIYVYKGISHFSSLTRN